MHTLVALTGLLVAAPTLAHRPLPTRPSGAAASAIAGPRIPQQQAPVADAGSFTLTQQGVKVGREVFTIRQMPPPDGGYLVDGAIVYPTRRIVPVLRSDSGGSPVHYQIDQFDADRRQQQLTLQVARGHGSVRVQTSHGESATELMVRPGVRLLDDDVFAQYYFVARATMRAGLHTPGQAAMMPLLIPRRGAVVAASITLVGEERLDVGGQTVLATHVRIQLAKDDVRDLWADPQGRVLRVAIPARALIASRDEAPP